MSDYMLPFTRTLNLEQGDYLAAQTVQTRRLVDMRGFYADVAAEEALAAENPLIYEVFYAGVTPEEVGQLSFCTTILYPGKVGDEYYMTKGHFHAKADRGEVYHGLIGEGMLISQTPDGKIDVQVMKPGVTAYVPPYWAHRTVNTGSGNFAFLAIYPSDAGYNYGIIAEQGFASIIVERDGQPTVIPNPRHKGG
jgi:glucose-6-phosphate isomerase